MFASRMSEYHSVFKYFNVISVLNIVLIIVLLNGIGRTTVLATEHQIETETKFAPEHIEKSCMEKCPDQNRNVSSNGDCTNKNCGRNQCAVGCKLWEIALDTSCMVACNKTELDVEDWYCVMGCNNAISQYFNWLMLEIGIPPAPALLADSLTATSLSLKWAIPQRLAEFMKRRRNILRNYLIQWRYEEIGNDWKYCRNQSMEDNSTIHVENLQPFTKYRFRVALILSAFRGIELHSEQSLVIITAEKGPPQSEPSIVRAVVVDHTRISISWEPGRLKNGPILVYVLRVKETTQDRFETVEDISKDQKEILIENLKPFTEYEVELKMRNRAGEGPAARVFLKTHPKRETRHDDETLKLIVVSEHKILMQGPKFFYEPPNIIYNSSDAITGIGIHVAKKLLFITDESRKIYNASLDYEKITGRTIPIYSSEGTNQIPLSLSVDWLNDKLYILFESDDTVQKGWHISRCNFDGKHLQVVYGGLRSKPVHFQVDPFNGFLFWSMNDTISGFDGLYRLDLRDVSNGVKQDISATLIFHQHHVGVFAIDYIHYKLLLPIEESNTVISLDLDGEKYQNIRQNIQTPMYDSVKTFAVANDLFYWTSGDALLMEEYHEASKFYFNNKFRDFAQLSSFLSVCVKLPSAQPIAKPVNPPSNVQALLSSDRAKVSWSIPHLLRIQGRGAWQDWNYEIKITEETNNRNTIIKNEIKGLQYTVTDLKPDTKYRFEVAAYTAAGYSPRSLEFIGQTLKTPHNRYLIWASDDGLVQSDTLGDDIRMLVPQSDHKQCNITNIDWYDDVLLFVCRNNTNPYRSTLFSFNRTSNATEMVNIGGDIQTIAFDWIGKRLYWFDAEFHVVTRGDLKLNQREELFSLNGKKVDMKIDALNGFLYFSTGHSVEYCRLNCNEKTKKEFSRTETYSRTEKYSQEEVMGLTLDFDMKRIYWIVQGYEDSKLISAPLAESDEYSFELQEFSLSDKLIQGPLAYLSNRLLWLQEDQTVAVSNLTGNNVAHIKINDFNHLNHFFVFDPTQHSIPNSIDRLNVVPEPVDTSTIEVIGKWDNFRIRWQPINTITYGDVFYKIRTFNQTVIVNESFVEINDPNLLPYSPINISIKAFTYWASSGTVEKRIHSPPSTPTHPTNTRIFISHMHNPIKNGLQIEAVFRWDEPAFLNGILTGYRLFCWHERGASQIELFSDYHLEPEISEKYMEPPMNVTLCCKVKAVTNGGEGNYSSVISMRSDIEKPYPRIFMSDTDRIYNVDLDLMKRQPIVSVGSRVECLCYIAMGEQLFWADENMEVMSYSGKSRQKLFSVNFPVLSITVDWIERIIYWSQAENNGSSISAYNLNTHKSKRLMHRTNYVYNLNVSPLNREMFWIEVASTMDTKGTLMSHQFHRNATNKALDSKGNAIIVSQKIMFLDTFTENEEKIIWLDEYNSLHSKDIKSSRIEILNFTFPSDAMNLTKDSLRYYWTQNNSLYAGNSVEEPLYQLHLWYPIRIWPTYRQNYPPLHCLLPDIQFLRHQKIELLGGGDRFLNLRLPTPKTYENCTFEPMFLKYQIMYSSIQHNARSKCSPETCIIDVTHEKVIQIENLRPFTEYQFQISISNFYMEAMNKTVNFTEPIVFRTEAGAPSKPRNLTATVLSPTEVNLKWLDPIEWNGPKIDYQVMYQTDTEINGVKNQLLLLIKDENVTSVNLTRLLTNQPYIIWIEAHTTDKLCNESLPIKITTLSDPRPIKLVNSTSTSLDIEWKRYNDASKYRILYRPIVNDNSSPNEDHINQTVLLDSNDMSFGDVFSAVNLRPRTTYKFWLELDFENRLQYVWPQNEMFLFKTKANRPNAPGKPGIIFIQTNVYKISWTKADDNGAPILEYHLEGLCYSCSNRVRRSTNTNATDSTAHVLNTVDNMPLIAEERNPIMGDWTLYYSGNDTYWIARNLTPISNYSFRVRARNINGWGEYSDSNDQVTDQRIFDDQRSYLIIAVAVPTFAIIILIVFTCLLCALRNRALEKKIFQEPNTRRSDVELANLSNVPHFVRNGNILYTVTGLLHDSDIASLPQISREQMTMGNYLGCGAFGEVYEGTVKNVGNEIETRVAIKTLRKGATEQEKSEFLEEAKLMSNFKHKHILSLIGVHLDVDALYIIMELMPGGDLLSYLRKSRSFEGGQLTLLDLTTMCVDIASGCRYLEEMHFVHRDLACRNCLVSSIDPDNRVVKIGDFGLARDIYKNDYYRKDGEGLLPVRWMAPESLVDGVFDVKSDIWAFGVLCWEIMTLGEQPYQARNNLEVLHYVRDGGHLDAPKKCPDDLFQLMMKCWSYRSEDRPTFRYCLDVLQSLRSNYENIHINMENTHRNLISGAKYVNTMAGPESYSIPKRTTNTKYLDILYNENDYPSPVNPYETPISTLDDDQSAINVQNNTVNLSNIDSIPKNRTISTSSTVSETSVFHPAPTHSINLVTNKNLISTVALPNSKEDCTSNEKLLMSSQQSDIRAKKLQQLYANSNIENAILNCEGITSM